MEVCRVQERVADGVNRETIDPKGLAGSCGGRMKNSLHQG